MSVRTGVLGRTTVVGAVANVVLGTVPASDTWIVKSVVIYNSGAVAASPALRVVNSGGTVNVALFVGSVAAAAQVLLSIWVAMAPGDQIQLDNNASTVAVWVSGADLPGHL